MYTERLGYFLLQEIKNNILSQVTQFFSKIIKVTDRRTHSVEAKTAEEVSRSARYTSFSFVVLSSFWAFILSCTKSRGL